MHRNGDKPQNSRSDARAGRADACAGRAGDGRPGADEGGLAEAGSRLTEQRNPRSRGLDALNALALVDLIGAEDRTVAGAVAAERSRIADAIETVVERLRGGGRLIYIGAGTSGRLGVLDAAECPPTFGTDPEMVQGVIAGGYGALVRAREGAEDDVESGSADIEGRGVGPNDVVMGIATCGGTPYVHAALTRARKLGAATIFLCCTPVRPGEVEADVIISPLVGPEVITGSTRMKAGTATKLVLNTITTSSMVLLGKTYGNLMVDLQATCDKLRDRARRIIVETTGAGYDEAGDIIDAAGGSVKLAIVMVKAGVDRDAAAKMVADARGSVARALGERE